MLLETNIKIEVTNDGKNNQTAVTTEKDILVKDMLLSIKLAEKTITEALANHVNNLSKNPTEKQLEKLYSKLKLSEL